jgi:hypothetical protein
LARSAGLLPLFSASNLGALHPICSWCPNNSMDLSGFADSRVLQTRSRSTA